jgi:hypothetical protein
MYSENKKKFLIFFFKPLSLLAHESFQSKSPEVWLATPDFFLRPPFSFWPTKSFQRLLKSVVPPSTPAACLGPNRNTGLTRTPQPSRRPAKSPSEPGLRQEAEPANGAAACPLGVRARDTLRCTPIKRLRALAAPCTTAPPPPASRCRRRPAAELPAALASAAVDL